MGALDQDPPIGEHLSSSADTLTVYPVCIAACDMIAGESLCGCLCI